MGPMVWRVIGTGSAVLAAAVAQKLVGKGWEFSTCLLYTSPSPRD